MNCPDDSDRHTQPRHNVRQTFAQCLHSLCTIFAGAAHIFEFLEDTALLEWWDCPYQAWFYKPYRDRVAATLQI